MILGVHIKDLYLGYHTNILQNIFVLFLVPKKKQWFRRAYLDWSTTSSIVVEY